METLLDVNDLQVRFHSDFGDRIVTDHIAFQVGSGEILGIVGESGSGKSVTSLALMGLLPGNGSVLSGSAQFGGRDLLALSGKELNEIRGRDICMIYQDALASLDPVFPVGLQITEAIRRHVEPDRKKAHSIAVSWLDRIGIPNPEQAMNRYPHEFSGGQRQRIMIAMGLSCRPKLLIADEPTTALDVTIQAQIMKIIRDLRRELGMSVILITHDIGLIAQNADRVLVMYAGQIMESAGVRELFHHPLHPYTRALLASAPDPGDARERRLVSIPGSVPENYTNMSGCRFASRCAYAGGAGPSGDTGAGGSGSTAPSGYICPECLQHQELREPEPGHFVRCIRADGF